MAQTRAVKAMGYNISQIKTMLTLFLTLHRANILIHAVSIAMDTQVDRGLKTHWIYVPGRDIIISRIFRHFSFNRYSKISLSICTAIRLKTNDQEPRYVLRLPTLRAYLMVDLCRH
jgi:hypothetical protein